MIPSSFLSQDDFADLEEVNVGGGGSRPVMSQPTAGQAAGAGMPVFAMPPPPGQQPYSTTNPFANETTSLNTADKPSYTPGT